MFQIEPLSLQKALQFRQHSPHLFEFSPLHRFAIPHDRH